MPLFSVPAINQAICTGWSTPDVNLYQKLPFYFAETHVDMIEEYSIWSKFCGTIPWKPNMGTTLRGTRMVASPNLRQFAFPNALTATPKMDTIGVRDVSVDEVLYGHQFESQMLNFLPDFQDFFNNHVERTREDIQTKITRFSDIFIRGKVFHRSPWVWLPNSNAGLGGGEAITAPYNADGNDAGTTGKTTAWIQQALAQLGQPGNLSMDTLSRLLPFMSTSLRAPVFMGSNMPKGSGGLTGKYCLVCSDEAYSRFAFDPYLKANRAIDLNIVTAGFTGDIFGRITCKLEDQPLRIAADGTFPSPETIELNPAQPNFGQTLPNSSYTEIANCPYEVAFLVAAKGYNSIEVGPPPSEFKSGNVPEGFGRLLWNGEIQMTKNILIPCIDEGGVTTQTTNKYGRYLQLISWLTLGCQAVEPRYIVPIIFKRVRGNGGTTGA